VFANLARGRNVAVVFSTKRGEPLPQSWQGFTVVDGDLSDLRFLDVPPASPPGILPFGIIIGLRAKGRAKTRTSGFVVQTSEAA
jgi:hypothetical protein